MKRRIIVGLCLLVVGCMLSCRGRGGAANWLGRVHPLPQGAVSILDGTEHIESEIHLAVPEVPRLCDELAVQKRRVPVEGAELYVETEGQGVPMVLCHGGPGATHNGFHPHFGQAADFAQVIYYDQRGCGLSDYAPMDGYTLDQAVDDLDRLRQALGHERWVVVGHSYGGLLAQAYSLKYPERLLGMVLVCAATGLHDPALSTSRQQKFITEDERAMMNRIRTTLRAQREEKGWTTAEYMALLVYNNHLNGDWKRQDFYRPDEVALARAARYEWHHDMENNFNGVMGGSIGKVDYQGAFVQCPIPTLILEGAWDLTWNESKPVVFQKNHPQSKMVVFSRSGHSPFCDEPEAFFGALRQFVTGLTAASSQDVAQWKSALTTWRETQAVSPAGLIRGAGWGRDEMLALADRLTLETLFQEVQDPRFLFKAACAFYEAERYQDARAVFQQADRLSVQAGRRQGVYLIWQGFVLDLAGEREEAKKMYREVVALGDNGRWTHSQYGLSYALIDYAKERLVTPFKRVENQE